MSAPPAPGGGAATTAGNANTITLSIRTLAPATHVVSISSTVSRFLSRERELPIDLHANVSIELDSSSSSLAHFCSPFFPFSDREQGVEYGASLIKQTGYEKEEKNNKERNMRGGEKGDLANSLAAVLLFLPLFLSQPLTTSHSTCPLSTPPNKNRPPSASSSSSSSSPRASLPPPSASSSAAASSGQTRRRPSRRSASPTGTRCTSSRAPPTSTTPAAATSTGSRCRLRSPYPWCRPVGPSSGRGSSGA